MPSTTRETAMLAARKYKGPFKTRIEVADDERDRECRHGMPRRERELIRRQARATSNEVPDGTDGCRWLIFFSP